MEINIMKEGPQSYGELLANYLVGLDLLLSVTWMACQQKAGIEQREVERKLTALTVAEVFNLAVEHMEPEEAAAFVTSIIDEYIGEAAQGNKNPFWSERSTDSPSQEQYRRPNKC